MRPMDNQTDPRWHRPFGDAARPLVRRYLRRGIHERMLASGAVLIDLDEAQAREELQVLKRCGIEGLAICLINSFVNPAHEERLLGLVRELFGATFPVSASFQVGPRAKEYARASTTVIDVMMKLIYGDYAQVLDEKLRASGFTGTLNFADCTAALIPWGEAITAPHRILFAGPAAGAAACCGLGAAIGDGNLIGCDVGGTSTDVTVIVAGAPFINDSFAIEHDLLVNTLATEVASVGAGGGSIVSVSAVRGPARRPAKRRGDARTCLLRTGRHAAHGHRCLPAHGHPRSKRLCGRPDSARYGRRHPRLCVACMPHVAG